MVSCLGGFLLLSLSRFCFLFDHASHNVGSHVEVVLLQRFASCTRDPAGCPFCVNICFMSHRNLLTKLMKVSELYLQTSQHNPPALASLLCKAYCVGDPETKD